MGQRFNRGQFLYFFTAQPRFCVVAHALLQTDVSLQKGDHGYLSGSIVNPVIKLLLDCFFFFPQLFQIKGINGPYFLRITL